MVEGPNEAFICADCVILAARIADANAGRLAPANLDLNEWRAAHMNFVCYVRVCRQADGLWTATEAVSAGVESRGSTAPEAVRLLQSKLLGLASESLLNGTEAGPYFTNHADPALR